MTSSADQDLETVSRDNILTWIQTIDFELLRRKAGAESEEDFRRTIEAPQTATLAALQHHRQALRDTLQRTDSEQMVVASQQMAVATTAAAKWAALAAVGSLLSTLVALAASFRK